METTVFVQIDKNKPLEVGELVYLTLIENELTAKRPTKKATKECPFLIQKFKVPGIPAIRSLAFVRDTNTKIGEAMVATVNLWDKKHTKELNELGWDTDGDVLWRNYER